MDYYFSTYCRPTMPGTMMQAITNKKWSCQQGLLGAVYGDPNSGVFVTKLLIKKYTRLWHDKDHLFIAYLICIIIKWNIVD